jgi:excisionase family DNA binding protein
VGDDMTLHAAAEQLGVHYMTAYRYVRLGLLPATKLGSTWRVAAADLATFRTGPSTERAAPGEGSARTAPWAARFESRLVAGDGVGAWGVVEAALTAGMVPGEVYLDVIAPALRQVGDRWAAGEIDVATEHRASGIAMRVVGRLGPRLARRGRTRGAVVVGTPAGERHSLPVAILADLLRSGGWEVSDLGCDVPAGAFAGAAGRTERLLVVGVSVTSPSCLAAAAETIAVLRAALGTTPILVGGGAVPTAAVAHELGADGWAPDGRAALATLDALAAGRSSDGLAG